MASGKSPAPAGDNLHTPAVPSRAALSTATAGPSGESSRQDAAQPTTTDAPPKKKRHRAGKKRRNRRQSFAAPSDTTEPADARIEHPNLRDVAEDSAMDHNFYRLGNQAARSNESLASEALLDHRDSEPVVRPRRPSVHLQAVQASRLGQSLRQSGLTSSPRARQPDEGDEEQDYFADDRTPLLRGNHRSSNKNSRIGFGGISESYSSSRQRSQRAKSSSSSINSQRKAARLAGLTSQSFPDDDYDVNNPPSVPGSPRGDSYSSYDVALPEFGRSQSPEMRSGPGMRSREAIIDIDRDGDGEPPTPGGRRRQTQTDIRDVCIPFDQMTDMAEDGEYNDYHQNEDTQKQHRRRRRAWPDLSVLEDYSLLEKEQEMEGIKAKKVNEPLYVGGRLRPKKGSWRREEEEAPFRWTYFNEEFDTTLRSHTISGLQQLGHSFRELFIPDRPELEESSEDDDDDSDTKGSQVFHPPRTATPVNGNQSRATTRQSSVLDIRPVEKAPSSGEHTGQNTPQQLPEIPAPKRYGPRPVFWLDVLQPTWDEMRVLSRAFAIHSLTSEDIMEQEAREKVELFRNYYFVNYRTFEHDEQSEDHLEPINMYFIVFKGGVISFHFSQMPHPPLVRRRMRQLAEHQYTDSDWISYAIIDNITDAYAPLIEQIEKDVDEIDDDILIMHRQAIDRKNSKSKPSRTKTVDGSVYDNLSDHGSDKGSVQSDIGRDMLLRVGECRKKVMGLYRLLGNKADVIKGLAKRCNEQWQVAPRSDVGLYLGDIQDHIVTMTANLTHYENILSRAHSNYLAQLNMSMNESAERNADVLGKLTVLGTIVLPMNIITGMWGMNVLVPGQVEDHPSLVWFWCITAGLLGFGLTCFFIAKRVYGIV